ncbi:MAG: hypothetical protein ACRDPW_01475 [Mycobacteriales bacterium]
MIELIPLDDLPETFNYPPEFIRIVELGVTDLEPWSILGGNELRFVYHRLRQDYPDQEYVPFATRQDNDDVACWAPWSVSIPGGYDQNSGLLRSAFQRVP